MKSFKNLSRSQQILTITAGLLAGVFFMYDGQDNSSTESGGYPNQVDNYADYSQTGAGQSNPIAGGSISADDKMVLFDNSQTDANQPTSIAGGSLSADDGGKVVLFDKGLQMPMGTYTLPAGWKLIQQDIATDPSTNLPVKHQVVFSGPQGALIKELGTIRYGQMAGGISFQQCIQQAVVSGLRSEIEQIKLGNPEPDQQEEQRAANNKIIRRLISQGMQVQCMKIPISGLRNGQMYEGYLQLIRIMPGNNPDLYGSVNVTCTIGQAGKSAALMQVKNKIADNYITNPAYQQHRDQLQAKVLKRQGRFHEEQMANARRLHAERMAGNKAAFDAHQGRMSDMSRTQENSYNSYMRGLRNSGTNNSSFNSGYDGQDYMIDGIHERTTFQDPSTGMERSLDGQYDYNYTDGQGNFHQTNDPSFDPNSLQGDWRKIEPLSPGY